MFGTFELKQTVTFAQLDGLLLSLGFEEIVDDYHEFRHPDRGTSVAFRLHQPDEQAYPADVGKTRGTLHIWGHKTVEEFDAWLDSLKNEKATHTVA